MALAPRTAYTHERQRPADERHQPGYQGCFQVGHLIPERERSDHGLADEVNWRGEQTRFHFLVEDLFGLQRILFPNRTFSCAQPHKLRVDLLLGVRVRRPLQSRELDSRKHYTTQ